MKALVVIHPLAVQVTNCQKRHAGKKKFNASVESRTDAINPIIRQTEIKMGNTNSLFVHGYGIAASQKHLCLQIVPMTIGSYRGSSVTLYNWSRKPKPYYAIVKL